MNVPSAIPWLDDQLHPRALALRRQASQLLADDDVVLGQPDAHDPEGELLALRLEFGDVADHGVELLARGQARVASTDGLDPRRDLVGHPVDDGVDQCVLRVEVVIEGAFRGVGGVEDVLDAELLRAAGLDQCLGGIDEDVPADGMGGGIECPGHGLASQRAATADVSDPRRDGLPSFGELSNRPSV